MVKINQQVVNQKYPILNLVNRLILRHDIKPPIDIEKLCSHYAKVEKLNMPYRVDGLSTNIDNFKGKPTIFVNTDTPPNRQRFTLAHELGHIIIPWHVGNIVDYINDADDGIMYFEQKNEKYIEYEKEANQFASDLLIPVDWLASVLASENALNQITRKVVEATQVSVFVACIKICHLLAPNYVFAILSEEYDVISSGRSDGTIASAPSTKTKISPDFFMPKVHRFDLDMYGYRIIWWDHNITVPVMNDSTDWRVILDLLIQDLTIDDIVAFKRHLNGIVAAANGQVKTNRSFETIYSACSQRIFNRETLKSFVQHSLFESYLEARVLDLYNKDK